jgi:hypothetical protein
MSAIVSGGIASFKVDGTPWMLRGDAEIKNARFKRAAIANQDGTVVFTKTAVPPMITLSLSDYGGMSLADLQAIEGSTINIALTNGKSYVLQNGFHVDESTLKTMDGAVSAAFSGSLCLEIGVKA